MTRVEDNDFLRIFLSRLNRTGMRFGRYFNRHGIAGKSVVGTEFRGKLAFRRQRHVNNETPAESRLRRQHKRLFDNRRLFQIENDAGSVSADTAQTGFVNQIVFIFVVFELWTDVNVKRIYNQTLGTVENKGLVIKILSASSTMRTLPTPCPIRMEVMPEAACAAGSQAKTAKRNNRPAISLLLKKPENFPIIVPISDSR